MDGANDFLGCGVDGLERLAVYTFDKLIVDEAWTACQDCFTYIGFRGDTYRPVGRSTLPPPGKSSLAERDMMSYGVLLGNSEKLWIRGYEVGDVGMM